MRSLGIVALGAVALATLPGCKKEEPPALGGPVPPPASGQPAPRPPDAAPAAEPPPPPLTGGGTVQGTVTFKGTPPPPAAIPPSMDPACEGMALADQAVRVQGGKLENVLVRVRGFIPGARPLQPAVIDQRQCTYVPRVQGVAANQPLLIKNSDGTLHNARALAGTKSIFNVAQPPHARPVERPLPIEAEVLRLKCDIHPWMTAWVVVSPNGFFSTTDAQGAFTIEHLPAGKYTLEAWHETLGTRTAEISVQEGQTTSASFEFSPEGAK